MSTLDQLRTIPDLAALVYLSADTPHRPPGRSKHGKLTASPMPPSVSAWDMLRPDESGLLHELTQAVRVVVEEMRAGDVWEPEPAADPTWASECGFLIATVVWWEADRFASEFVRDAAKTVHRDLSRWVGEQPPRPLKCTKCRGHVHRDRYGADGAQAVACSDCGHLWHPKDLAHEATMATPAPLPAIASLLGLTERTLQRWVSAGLAHPTTDHTPTPRQPAMYLPQDLARLATMIREQKEA